MKFENNLTTNFYPMREKERQQFPEIFDKFNKLDTRYTFKNLYFFD